MNPSKQWFSKCGEILQTIQQQDSKIQQAADWFAESILAGRMVHLFGAGHSRIMVEEMWPRHGSYPGYHPIVPLAMTFHNSVVGANGQRQCMYIENVQGLSKTILRNFDLSEKDCALVISCSGRNISQIEMAEEFQKKGIKVVVITADSYKDSKSKDPRGKHLRDFADLIIDNGVPIGDALVKIKGLETPVAPGSTIGGCLIIGAIKAEVARRLTEAGKPPTVLTSTGVTLESGKVVDKALNLKWFNEAYDQHAHLTAKLYENLGRND